MQRGRPKKWEHSIEGLPRAVRARNDTARRKEGVMINDACSPFGSVQTPCRGLLLRPLSSGCSRGPRRTACRRPTQVNNGANDARSIHSSRWNARRDEEEEVGGLPLANPAVARKQRMAKPAKAITSTIEPPDCSCHSLLRGLKGASAGVLQAPATFSADTVWRDTD